MYSLYKKSYQDRKSCENKKLKLVMPAPNINIEAYIVGKLCSHLSQQQQNLACGREIRIKFKKKKEKKTPKHQM